MTLFQEGAWVWVRTGEPLDFSAWFPGQPDNGDEPYNNQHCAMYFVDYIKYGGTQIWNDLECFFANAFKYKNRPICQKY